MVRLAKRFRRQTQLSIIFIIDPPAHDEWAVPLLCSLALYAPEGAALMAYVPDWKLPLVTPLVRTLMDKVGVEVRTFDPGLGDRLFASDYSIGNKIIACQQPRENARTIFLDTDIFLNAPLNVDAFFAGQEVAICSAEFNSFSNKARDWQGIYQLFGLELPGKSMVASRSGIEMFPYFNAGVIGFTESSGFGEMWAETASQIDHADLGVEMRPWLDQVALPVVLERLGIEARHLEPEWNFALNGMKVGRDLEPGVRIAHFHLVRFLLFTMSYQRVTEILREILGPVLLTDIAEQALREREAMLEELSQGDATLFERKVLERGQEVSARRLAQLGGR